MTGLGCLGWAALILLVVGAMWWTDQHIDPDDPDEQDMDRHSW